MKTIKRKGKLVAAAIVSAAAMALCGGALVACGGFNPKTDIPNINDNASLSIERDRLSFALNMDNFDAADIIARCGCTLMDDEGHEVTITQDMIADGRIQHDPFELDTVGSNKRITVKYKKAVNYIFYDVCEYSVTFFSDEDQQTVWKTDAAQAEFTDDLDLSVWVNLNDYNYSTDSAVRQSDAYGAEHFCGWYDSNGSLVTGKKALSVSSDVTEANMELRAHYLSDEEFSALKLGYDSLGRREFLGYNGTTTEVDIPEGVTYINLSGIFNLTPEASSIGFSVMNVPSTARLDVPLTGLVNTVGLTEINVNAGSPYYSSYNGGLYSKDYKTLHLLPASYSDNEFHPELEIIGTYACAFWECKAFTIPDSVKVLQDYCFYRSSLLRVDGYKDLTQGVGVFYGTNIPEMNIVENGAVYMQMGDVNGAPTYALSMITDKSITSFKLKEGTVSISDSAFADCTLLKEVDLGNSLQRIGNLTFSGCTSLESIVLPASLERFGEGTFYECSALKNVDMSALKKMIYLYDGGMLENTLPEYFFWDCTALESVELPLFIQAIATSAFRGCSNLQSVNLDQLPLRTVMTSAFYGMGADVSGGIKVTLPATVRSIGKQAFSHSGVTEINLEECTELTQLEERTFEYSKLTKIEIPEKITTVPAYCFYYTPSLASVTLNNVVTVSSRAFQYHGIVSLTDFGKVESIGQYAFGSSSKLTTVTLSDSVKTVADNAFGSCSRLSVFTLGKNTETFGNYAFIGETDVFDAAVPATYLCRALTQINVPEENEYFTSIDGVLYGKSVGGRDFGDAGVLCVLPAANGMTEYEMPESVKVILPYSVLAHKTLTKIVMNDGLENIGKGAFYQSTAIREVSISKTVTQIGANIFLGCPNVERVTLSAENQKYETETGNLIYERASNTLVMCSGTEPTAHIKEGTLVIDSAVFMQNAKVTEIMIPDSVVEIGSKAFDGCTSLETLQIGAGVRKIDPTAFASLRSLKSIVVSADNQFFKTSADNTLLYSKDGKKLWLCAVAGSTRTEITAESGILDGVEEIGNYAFAYHKTLKTIKLPAGVTTIGNYAFYNCRALETFYAAPTLTEIGNYAFAVANESSRPTGDMRYCDTLKTVLLYSSLKNLGDYCFYGQYGIENSYFAMTYSEYVALAKSGTNTVYVTHGCPVPNGSGYVNNGGKGINVFIESNQQPLYTPETYQYFHMVDGEPVVWES